MPAKNNAYVRIYCNTTDGFSFNVCSDRNNMLLPYNRAFRYFSYNTRKPLTSMLEPGTRVIIAIQDKNGVLRHDFVWHITRAYQIPKRAYQKMEDEVRRSEVRHKKAKAELINQYEKVIGAARDILRKCQLDCVKASCAIPQPLSLADLVKKFIKDKKK